LRGNDGAGRERIRRSRCVAGDDPLEIVAVLRLGELDAKPSSNSRTTRPTQRRRPTACRIPADVGDTATPDTDMSMTKQGLVVPSARIRVECGLTG